MGARLRNASLAAIAAAMLYWLSDLSHAALRDPRFFDGWVLLAAMAGQLLFHIRKQFIGLSAGRAATWLTVHIYGGYFVIAAFLIHCGFSWPDALFEWVLWAVFVLVAASGIAGAYLSRAVPARLGPGAEEIAFERIPAQRLALAGEVDALASQSVRASGSPAISEIYVSQLRSYFRAPRNLFAHLRGSRRAASRLCAELEQRQRYVDEEGAEALRAIRDKVVAKDNLDFQYAHQGLLQLWLFVHIPATYCLIVLTALHVAVVYAFSAGVP